MMILTMNILVHCITSLVREPTPKNAIQQGTHQLPIWVCLKNGYPEIQWYTDTFPHKNINKIKVYRSLLPHFWASRYKYVPSGKQT